MMNEEKEMVERWKQWSRVVACAMLVSGVFSGCGEDHPETAQETFKAYLRNVYLNKDAEAFALVAPADRERLVALRDELERAGASKRYEPHETLLVRAIVNPYALRSVEIDPEEAGPGITRLRYTLVDGQEGTADMVRGSADQRWYLKVLP